MVKNTVPTTPKPQIAWVFKKRNDWWEAYLNPSLWPHDLPIWLFNTFGEPVRNGLWDYHSGWVKFRERKHVDWFLLKWT
jgi:hypothetical protein